ncbi:hypothetical protein Tco_0238164 [Tanacetum coccineum]
MTRVRPHNHSNCELSQEEFNEFLALYPVPSEYHVILPKSNQTIFDAPPGVTPPSNAGVEMPRVESVRPSGVIIEDWVSDDDEDIFQSNDSQTTVKPSFKKIEFTKAKNEPVKSDKQAVKPRMRMAKKSVLQSMGKNTGHREVRTIWNNTQRINHQNKFVPTAVLTRVSNEKVNTIRVNGVNTVGKTTISTVKGNGFAAVEASAGYVWRPKMTDLNNGFKDNSRSWISKIVNYIDP